MPLAGVGAMANVAHAVAVGAEAPPQSPLQPGDHYILRKLNNQVLPWIIAGRRLQRLWMVRVARLYDYISNLAAALAAYGIGAPITSLVSSGKAPEGKSAIQILQDALPWYGFWIGVVALAIWIALRIFVQREDILGRALLARDCAHTMRSLNQELYVALSDADPMPTISKVQKSVDDQVANALRNRVWPWDPLPPAEEMAAELKRTTDGIRDQFMNGWTPSPARVN